MARATPLVHNDNLMYQQEGGEETIRVGSPAWQRWLEDEQNTTFRFEHLQGSFTARRERKGGRCYWYAYRKQHGRLHKAYLGKSEELQPGWLATVGALLASEES